MRGDAPSGHITSLPVCWLTTLRKRLQGPHAMLVVQPAIYFTLLNPILSAYSAKLKAELLSEEQFGRTVRRDMNNDGTECRGRRVVQDDK